MNYKEIIKNVLENGVPKQATRIVDGKAVDVENPTIGTFCEIFRHDMSKGFPLTTLRRMPWKSLSIELEGFIKGITYKSWYQERKCKYWDHWANPQKVEEIEDAMEVAGEEFDRKQCQKDLKDLGPIYGAQWRRFGEHYGERYNGTKVNGVSKGTDQLSSIVNKLHANPYDRRMVCSAWNPNQMDMMALPPCHYVWNVVVYGNKLNLVWHQRSCDLMLGVGSNIASYGLLLLLLCEEASLEPGELVGTLADCHIYENHLDAARELVKRDERPLPEVKIERKYTDCTRGIFDWTYDEVELIGYDPHPKLDMGAVTV